MAHVAQVVERFLGKEEVHRFESGRGLHKDVLTMKHGVDRVGAVIINLRKYNLSHFPKNHGRTERWRSRSLSERSRM